MVLTEMGLAFVNDHIRRKFLARLLSDDDILELDGDTFNFIWEQCGLENNKMVQESLKDEKEQFLKEMSIDG